MGILYEDRKLPKTVELVSGFAQLSQPVAHVLREISKPERSEDPIARIIVDGGVAGTTRLGATVDASYDRVLRIFGARQNVERVLEALSAPTVPGVKVVVRWGQVAILNAA